MIRNMKRGREKKNQVCPVWAWVWMWMWMRTTQQQQPEKATPFLIQ